MTLCRVAVDSSMEVKNWIDQQNGVKEESITDWLLYNMSKNSRGSILYHGFSRHEESCNGADWDWWIACGHGYLRLRVQAKRLRVKLSGLD